jgi:hypothetical protein
VLVEAAAAARLACLIDMARALHVAPVPQGCASHGCRLYAYLSVHHSY